MWHLNTLMLHYVIIPVEFCGLHRDEARFAKD
jgi:hypothetical protein